MSAALKKIRSILPGKDEDPEKRWFKIIVYTSIAILLLMFITGYSVFMFALQGSEQTMVPEVRGLELVEALIELQNKELYPKVQVRFSTDPTSKGKILEQQPMSGSLVKAGKRITLTVSKGAVVDTIEDYKGRLIDDLRMELLTKFASYEEIIKIKEPVVYVPSDEPRGTILEQKPPAGTRITGFTELELIVSKGIDEVKVPMPSFAGLTFEKAVELLAKRNIPFTFKEKLEPEEGKEGIVVLQNPAPGTEVPEGSPLGLIYNPPLEEGAKIYGLFEYTLPNYPVRVDLKVERVSVSGDREEIFSMKHPGGEISFPYAEEENTVLILSIFDNEVIRHYVQQLSTE